jgi:phosphoglucomutase
LVGVRYGYFATRNSYVISPDKALNDRVFRRLRFGFEESVPDLESKDKLSLPETLAGLPVLSIRDLTLGYDSSAPPPDYVPDLPVSSSSHMITFTLRQTSAATPSSEPIVDVVGTVRTSGTEPKIKYYLEASGSDRTAVESTLVAVEDSLKREWLRCALFGLQDGMA